jgi:HAD superfamily hydrolase (TIGR01509 family)
MQDLKKRGYKLAVASNTRRVYLNIIVRSLGIADLLDCTVAGDEVLHGKPHPECFIKAMAALNVDPLHAIVFEDSDAGKQAARASGATLIEVDPTTLITINQIANII